MQGETVKLTFTSSDAHAGGPLVVKDADGVARVIAANERLLIDTLSGNSTSTVNVTGTGVLAVVVGTSPFEAGPEGQAAEIGVTPTVTANAGQVDLAGSGRIVKAGSLAGISRPAFKETFGGH